MQSNIPSGKDALLNPVVGRLPARYRGCLQPIRSVVEYGHLRMLVADQSKQSVDGSLFKPVIRIHELQPISSAALMPAFLAMETPLLA